MSPSTVRKGPLARASEAKAKPAATMHPIPVLDTPLAKTMSLARPALLLGLLAARFESLVRDPVATLWSALPALAAIQAAYAVRAPRRGLAARQAGEEAASGREEEGRGGGA